MKLKFLNILKKNFQFFWNNKLSSLIFLLGPLILILIVGAVVQDPSIKNIKAGIYLSSEELDTAEFFQKLEARSFNIKIENSLETCKRNVREGVSHVCIELKKAETMLPLSQIGYPNYDVKVYLDTSKQRIVWSIIGEIQKIVDEESYNARALLIEELKEDARESSQIIQSQESKINFAIYQLQNLDLNLNSILQEEQMINAELDEIRQDIVGVIQKLNYIKTGVFLPPTYLIYLENSISTLENINQKILALPQTSNSIEEVRNYIRVVENQLEEVRLSLGEVRNNLEKISEENLDRVSNPIYLEYESIGGEGGGTIKKPLGFLDYLFPNFLMFFMLFNAVIFSSVIRIRERKSEAYIRNISSKVSGFNFVLGDFLTSFIFAIVQVLIILGIASFFLNINLLFNIVPLAEVLLITIIIFTVIGIFIGSALRTQEATVIAAICVSLLLFIFSSMIIPIETLPKVLSQVASFLPLTLLETKLRLILIFGSGLHLSLPEMVSLAGILVILIILTLIFYKRSKEKEI